MGSYVKVSVPRMKDDGEQLHTQIAKIPQFIRELEGSMKSLGSCWDGPAWVTFQQQVESDILNMLEMYDWLCRYLRAMSDAEKEYGNCEEKSYSSVEKVRI